MPDVTVTQNPAIVYDQVLTFPFNQNDDVLPLVNPGYPQGRLLASDGAAFRNNTFTQQYSQQTNNAAAAGFSYTPDAAGGPPYFQIGSAGLGRYIAGLDAMNAQVDTGVGRALTAGCQRASVHRYWWLTWWMSSDMVGGPDYRNGLLLQPGNNANNYRWPDDPVGPNNAGGFGFNGDGAGNWQYVSYDRSGILLQREAIALPAHTVADWNQFEIAIQNAQPGAPASVELLFNGVLIATRNWTGVLLEDYAALEWRFLPTMAGGNAAAAVGDCRFANIVCRKGRYTRLGLELTA